MIFTDSLLLSSYTPVPPKSLRNLSLSSSWALVRAAIYHTNPHGQTKTTSGKEMRGLSNPSLRNNVVRVGL